MKTHKNKSGKPKPVKKLKQKTTNGEDKVLQKIDGDPDETALCVPGGKCYTQSELAVLETLEIPLFSLDGDDHASKN